MKPTGACDMCGSTAGVEFLKLGGGGSAWNLARVCRSCQQRRLMPVLRRLFGGAVGLNMPGPGGEREHAPATPAAFETFEAAGAVHVLEAATRHPNRLFRARSLAVCGAEHEAEPTPRAGPVGEDEPACEACAEEVPAAYGGASA